MSMLCYKDTIFKLIADTGGSKNTVREQVDFYELSPLYGGFTNCRFRCMVDKSFEAP